MNTQTIFFQLIVSWHRHRCLRQKLPAAGFSVAARDSPMQIMESFRFGQNADQQSGMHTVAAESRDS
jgi:hypothetical protein